MIRPSKHSHPDKTVVNICLLVIMRMKARRHEPYADLRDFVKSSVRNGDILFLPALNLLYLLGLIEYHPKNDAIEYVGTS
jgi:hypothetical protein